MTGKVQVVTGGTSGMGLATAKAVSKYGPVIIGGRNEKRLVEAVSFLESAGVEAYGATLDVSDAVSVRSFADEALKAGPIGNVVHAAAVDMDNADVDTILNVNVQGTINVCETFFPLIEEGGSLANYSSVTGYYYHPSQEEIQVWSKPADSHFVQKFKKHIQVFDAPDAQVTSEMVAYFSSKNFVMFYTKANAERFGKKGCRVFSVAPGSFMTPMLELQSDNFDSIKKTTVFGRFGKPEEMAQLFADLLDPRVSYLTGCDVLMDGGMFAKRMVPQLT